MKTKVLLIATASILAVGGVALHTGNEGECPFGKPCKLFKTEASAVKSEKNVELAKVEIGTLEKE